MSKLTFHVSPEGKLTYSDTRLAETIVMKREDWDLAIEVANADKNGNETAFTVIQKNRPGNIIYGVLEKKLVMGVLVKNDDDSACVIFENGTVSGIELGIQDNDVAYTDPFEASKETGLDVGVFEENDINAQPSSLADALGKFFTGIVKGIKQHSEEVENMSEEERQEKMAKTAILMYKLKLMSRRQTLMEMVNEIDTQIKAIESGQFRIINPDDLDDDNDDF